MNSDKLYQGYQSDFLYDVCKTEVSLPIMNDVQMLDLVKDENEDYIIKYINYSVALSKSYKFAYFTATNIDGKLFKKVPRKDRWRKDPRINSEFQWGKEFYTAKQSTFDRGHLTKREDVQWGETAGIALNAADSTFFYTNSVPQHRKLNRDVWRSLEDYILHAETKQNSLRVCVFTGPVLSKNNPYYATLIGAESVQIPVLFWKVIIFPKYDGTLYRVGFMMSQKSILTQSGIIEELESGSRDEDLFLKFKDAETYQVNISLIESISGLKMPLAIDSYTDNRKNKLVFEDIDIDPELESKNWIVELGFNIQNLIL